MPRPTKRQKQSRKAARQNIKRNINSVQVNVEHDKSEGYDNIDNDLDNVSFDNKPEDYDDAHIILDEPLENNNAVSIVRKLQEAAKKYHQEHTLSRLRYIGNSSRTKRRKI